MRKAAIAVLLLAGFAVAKVETGSVKSSDGLRIVYDVRGEGETALVFVHCWSCDRTYWKNQADAFADRYQVVTLDLGGHGESGKNRKKWTVLGLAEDVRAVADKLKLKRMILVGHSMGGPVSLEAARLMRGRVLGVIAADTLQNAEQTFPKEMLQSMTEKLKADFVGTIKGFMGSMVSAGAEPGVREWIEKKVATADPAVGIALMLDFENVNMPKLFSGAGVPIRGINASAPYPTNIEANRKYADFDAVLMEGVGHFLQLERPREFNEHLARWARILSK